MQKTFPASKLSYCFRILDYLLLPIMYIAGGLKKDSLQITHPWHLRVISPELIDVDKIITITGTDLTKWKRNKGPLFHFPIFGGWKEYAVLKFETGKSPYYLGWVDQTKKSAKNILHILPILDDKIKVLSGPVGSDTCFFAFDSFSKPVELAAIDKGKLGDMQYPNIRLY